jgi:hypothetical protein
MSRTNHLDTRGGTSNDDELLRAIEQHLPTLWRVQRHVGNHGLLSVLKIAERKLSQRRESSNNYADDSWNSEDGASAVAG